MIAPGTAHQEIRLDRLATGARVRPRFQMPERLRHLAFDATGVAVAAVMLFPIYWMVATAFKPGRDILRLTPKWFPDPFTLQNFEARGEIHVIGAYLGRNVFPSAIRLLEQGRLDLEPLVTHRVRLEELPWALERLRQAKAAKVVVELQ